MKQGLIERIARAAAPLALALALWGAADRAEAGQVHLGGPPGGGGSRVVVGSSTDGRQYVVWQSVDVGASRECRRVDVGSLAGLSDHLELIGTKYRDEIVVVGTGSGAYLECPNFGRVTLGPVVLGGYSIDIWALAGDDFVSGGTGAHYLVGGAGHDRLVSSRADVVMTGWDGNDVLLSLSSSGSGETLLGDEGNDCLYDANRSSKVASCGDDTEDRFVSGMSVDTDCEIPVPRC
jgi:hypothetical protein